MTAELIEMVQYYVGPDVRHNRSVVTHAKICQNMEHAEDFSSANRGIGYVTLCDTTEATALHAKGPLLQLLQTNLNTR